MRLFIAIELSGELRKALAKLQRVMEKNGFLGRFTPEENFHLTLAFLGDYGNPDAVMDAMVNIRFSEFTLSLQGIGNFDDIWWSGVEKSDALEHLAARVRHALADAGIPFDRKSFSPHITLLRDAYFPDELPEIRIPEVSMRVDGFSLFRSERGKSGMIYTELGRIAATVPE